MRLSTFILKSALKAAKTANRKTEPQKLVSKKILIERRISQKGKYDPYDLNRQFRQNNIYNYQDEVFTLGYDVNRSNNPNECEICNKLAGKYPKWFLFTGWCEHCKCFITPILANHKDFSKIQDAILEGKDPKKVVSKKMIMDVPTNFKKWVKENLDNPFIEGIPRFVKDNFIDGDIKNGLKKHI